MNAISADTTIEAAAKQFEILRKMTIQQRAQITFDLIENLRRITEAGVRQRHPDYDDQQVNQAVTRLTLGDQLFRQAYRDIDIEP